MKKTISLHLHYTLIMLLLCSCHVLIMLLCSPNLIQIFCQKPCFLIY